MFTLLSMQQDMKGGGSYQYHLPLDYQQILQLATNPVYQLSLSPTSSLSLSLVRFGHLDIPLFLSHT